LPPQELAARAAELLPGVARLASARVEIEAGYRFEFISSTAPLGAILASRRLSRHRRRTSSNHRQSPDWAQVFSIIDM
jgi:hypothetical protein